MECLFDQEYYLYVEVVVDMVVLFDEVGVEQVVVGGLFLGGFFLFVFYVVYLD